MSDFEWSRLSFQPSTKNINQNYSVKSKNENQAKFIIPDGVIGFVVNKKLVHKLIPIIGHWHPELMLIVSDEDRDIYLMRTDCSAGRFDDTRLPSEVRLVQPGDTVRLPPNPEGKMPETLEAIHHVHRGIITEQLASGPEPEISDSPFAIFSVRGRAAEFERKAIQARPLLGMLCMFGQATIWYAPPNAGKTLIALKLIIDAVISGLINPANIIYINADDSSSGFADKIRLMDDLGAHTLSPGLNGLKAENLIALLYEVAKQGKARGLLIILDTIKKFVSLMDKSKASEFAQACRAVVMQGGSILALAHTTKSPNADGSLRYAGTTDMVDDFDAAYTITPLDAACGAGEKVVRFDLIKRRGDNVSQIAYAYAAEGSISYAERLASVRVVDHDQLDQFQIVAAQRQDAELIAVIEVCITDGVTAKMALAKAAAVKAGVSERTAIRVIEAHTGTDPAVHRWTYSVQARGAKVFALLPPPPISDVPPGA